MHYSEKQISQHTMVFEIDLQKSDYFWVGTLIDSIDNLAIHTIALHNGIFEVLVPVDFADEFVSVMELFHPDKLGVDKRDITQNLNV